MATYDPKEILASYGPIILGDYSDGTFVNITQDIEDYRTERGCDGQVDFVKNTGITFTIEISISQTSQVNALLSASRILDVTGNIGALPFLIKDNGPNGSTLIFLPRARIMAPPKLTYGSSTAPRVWTFKGISGEQFTGGN